MTQFSATDIQASYGKMQAVAGVAIEVPQGSVVTLIGANGAGKTTLLSALMGLMRSTGSVRFEGHDLSAVSVEERVKAGISLVSEQRDLFGSMSVEDNLLLGSYRRGRESSADMLREVFRRFPRLDERRRQQASTLSGGERQMLAMGRALMARPKLLMLDEPSLGLAPLIVREVFRIITELREDGISILLVEQNARAALEVADYGYVMELGKLSMEGKASALLQDTQLVKAYLGQEPKQLR
ncbi:amino acid/amide ABC transporter ATP-binding protein 2, HAAT family [Mesorhizobium australicum]|uniref:Amino acid/amide ABC transporter ATP-binding protein 2, HAAT family n=2 Tax=Mesorhizobium australicum TaxID=536018 RepID=A0A1X7MUM5_9HYPH|nr:amino acid/amide ABC transporter ATP-binding protein 2, HAAT family [Mesorhizobium australicum]